MRKLRSSLTVLAAALYVLLGISASWHAPHFTRGETAVGVDRHGGHETALDGESCALCSSKKSAQEVLAHAGCVVRLSRVESVSPVRVVPVIDEPRGSTRARAPPALS